MADDIVTIAEFIASEVGFYSPGMVVQAQDLIAWLLERGFAVVAADKIERLWALADQLANALKAVQHDRPSAHTDDVWAAINQALITHEEARREP